MRDAARFHNELADAIARDFGSVERWRTEFAAMGKAEGGGSGWVILAYSPRDKRLVNQWAADHTTTLAGGRPVLVLDMYEHAYHMDYGAAAARYVDIYMEAICVPNPTASPCSGPPRVWRPACLSFLGPARVCLWWPGR